MERKDAIATFGRHYQINAVSQAIEERLGRALGNAAYNFDRLEDAEEALAKAVRKNATDRVREIRRETETVKYRAIALLAKYRLHPEGKDIRERDRILKDALRSAQAILTSPHPIPSTLHLLPETIRMPAPLDVGQAIHKVRAGGYHDGYDIETLKITGRTIERCLTFMSRQYDYHYAYKADGPHTKALRFYYDHADLSTDVIDAGHGERRYFLRSEPAEEMTLEMIGRLTGEFNKALKDINRRRMERGEPSLPLLRETAGQETKARTPLKPAPAPRSDAIRLNPPS